MTWGTVVTLGLVIGAGGAAVAQERVASVTLDLPEPRATAFRHYLTIQAGDILEPAAVRRSVELLFATGHFEDVSVEASHTEKGIDVVFRPIPAPLLRRVRVEGDKVLSAGAVRRFARLRDGEPLWPARLESAAQATGVALAADGYLESHVTGESRPTTTGTDAVFRVTAGPRVRVGRVTFEWGSTASSPTIQALAPRTGEVFRRAAAHGAAERMKGRLVKDGLWRARVTLDEAYNPPAARMDLIYRVTPGERTEIEFRGSPLPGGLRRSVLALLRDGGLENDVLDEANDRIEEALRADGHRDAFVSRREESREGVRVIAYVTEPGPQARVGSVRFSGLEDTRLRGVVQTTAPGVVVDRIVDEDVHRLERFLAEQGYPDGKVEAEIPEGGGDLPVHFSLRPGPRTIVGSARVDVTGGEPPSSAPELRTKVGEPYRVRDVTADREALLAAYRNRGHLQVTVVPEVSFSDGKDEATVVFRVTPGALTEVGRVVVARLGITRPEVVSRELTFKEGAPLGLSEVLESQRRLSALGIFSRVNISEMDPEAVERRTLVVAAEEAPRTTVAYAVGYAERDLLRGSVEVTRRNLFGLDRSLTAFARGSFRGNRLLTTFREPYLFGRRLALFVTGFREEEERDGFSYIRYGGLLQTALRGGAHRGLILRFSYQKTDLFDVTVPIDEIDRQFQTSTSAGPSASLIEDTRDDPLDPHAGHFFSTDLQLSDSIFGGDNFVKSFLQVAGFRQLYPRVLLALSGRVGLAATLRTGDPDRLPLPDRFFAGGDNSLRGFPLDMVGPLVPSSAGGLVPTGGNALLLGSAELRIDAARRVGVALFSDSGNVYPLVPDLTLSDIRYTAGLGLRYKTALGPLRVDWGYKLNRRPGESASHFHFTIGNAF